MSEPAGRANHGDSALFGAARRTAHWCPVLGTMPDTLTELTVRQ